MYNKYNIPKKDYENIKGIAYKIYVKSFTGVEFDDLIQEGVYAYLKAKEKYDPSKNDYFMGFAYKKIKGRMLDWVAKYAYNKYGAIKQAEKKHKYWIDPTPENYEDFHVNYDFDKDINDYNLKEDIKEYISNFMTKFEQWLFYQYFIEKKSLAKLENEIGILNKVNIKNILIKHLEGLKQYIELGDIKGLSNEELQENKYTF